jgi:hypothetical protein
MFFPTLMQVLNVAIGGGHARCHLHLSAYVHTGGHARCRTPSRLHGRLAALWPTFIPQTQRRLQLRSCAHVIPAPQTSTPLAWIFSLPRRAVLSIAPFIWYASVRSILAFFLYCLEGGRKSGAPYCDSARWSCANSCTGHLHAKTEFHRATAMLEESSATFRWTVPCKKAFAEACTGGLGGPQAVHCGDGMQAYVHHIRRAKHFVYVENQYFLGSCYEWEKCRDVGCHHTVCAELTEKICSKIRAREPFAAYIVQPMFPEGDPYAGARLPLVGRVL